MADSLGPPPGQAPFTVTEPSVSVEAAAGDELPLPPECLSDDEILLYRQGETSEEQRGAIHRHLDLCTACREVVHFIVQDDPLSNERSLEVTTFAPGNVVKGRYAIERFVGKGGMGEVYRGFDLLLGQAVALKTLLCTSTDDPRAVRKLFDEVRNAQRVGHPHVCRIFELQEHEDPRQFARPVPFFTMEFVEGERLSSRMGAERLSTADVRTIALQLLDGLKAAHGKGVLHLDFKGDNVLLRQSSLPLDAVIMDFGLSRAFDTGQHVHTSERLQGAGTLPYMSLEQLECRADVGPAADVYAFGVVLYEMLTGRLPFEGATPSAMLLRQLKERPVPPSSSRPRLTRALDAFVFRCLNSDPRARYADAGAALKALEGVMLWERPVRARARRHDVALAAIVVGALSGAGLLVLGGAARDQERSTPTPLADARAPAPAPTSHTSHTSTALGDPSPVGTRYSPLKPAPVQPARQKAAATPARSPTRTDDTRQRQPRVDPGKPRSDEAPGIGAVPGWTPRAVPTGGFWQPSMGPQHDSPQHDSRSDPTTQ